MHYIRYFADKYGLKLPVSVISRISEITGPCWDSCINEDNRKLCTSDAIDLLNRMLTIDLNLRPSAEELMSHPFFNQIKV